MKVIKCASYILLIFLLSCHPTISSEQEFGRILSELRSNDPKTKEEAEQKLGLLDQSVLPAIDKELRLSSEVNLIVARQAIEILKNRSKLLLEKGDIIGAMKDLSKADDYTKFLQDTEASIESAQEMYFVLHGENLKSGVTDIKILSSLLANEELNLQAKTYVYDRVDRLFGLPPNWWPKFQGEPEGYHKVEMGVAIRKCIDWINERSNKPEKYWIGRRIRFSIEELREGKLTFQEPLDYLIKATGQDFEFDQEAWRAWWKENKKDFMGDED